MAKRNITLYWNSETVLV